MPTTINCAYIETIHLKIARLVYKNNLLQHKIMTYVALQLLLARVNAMKNDNYTAISIQTSKLE